MYLFRNQTQFSEIHTLQQIGNLQIFSLLLRNLAHNKTFRRVFHHENKNKNKFLQTFPFVPMSIQIRNAKRTCKNK